MTEGPESGHTFRFYMDSRGSHGLAGQDLSQYKDSPHWDSESGMLRMVEVRAWNLRDALGKAQRLSLDTWLEGDLPPNIDVFDWHYAHGQICDLPEKDCPDHNAGDWPSILRFLVNEWDRTGQYAGQPVDIKANRLGLTFCSKRLAGLIGDHRDEEPVEEPPAETAIHAIDVGEHSVRRTECGVLVKPGVICTGFGRKQREVVAGVTCDDCNVAIGVMTREPAQP